MKFYMPLIISVILYFNQLALATNTIENKSVFESSSLLKEQVELQKSRYIVGGIISIFGFGIGSAIQGRWTKMGWVFTALDVTFVGILAYNNIRSLAELRKKYPTLNFTMSVIRVWQIANAWILPKNYKLVSSSFQLTPVFAYNKKAGLNLGFSLNYRF